MLWGVSAVAATPSSSSLLTSSIWTEQEERQRDSYEKGQSRAPRVYRPWGSRFSFPPFFDFFFFLRSPSFSSFFGSYSPPGFDRHLGKQGTSERQKGAQQVPRERDRSTFFGPSLTTAEYLGGGSKLTLPSSISTNICSKFNFDQHLGTLPASSDQTRLFRSPFESQSINQRRAQTRQKANDGNRSGPHYDVE